VFVAYRDKNSIQSFMLVTWASKKALSWTP